MQNAVLKDFIWRIVAVAQWISTEILFTCYIPMWPRAFPIEQEVKYAQNKVYVEYAMSQGRFNKHLHILKSIVQDTRSQKRK